MARHYFCWLLVVVVVRLCVHKQSVVFCSPPPVSSGETTESAWSCEEDLVTVLDVDVDMLLDGMEWICRSCCVVSGVGIGDGERGFMMGELQYSGIKFLSLLQASLQRIRFLEDGCI